MSSKYHSTKTMIDGILFASKAEAARYLELKTLEKLGELHALRWQVKFELIPKMAGERAVYYIADFAYIVNGKQIVEDVKGTKTQVYIIKRKLLLWVHGIRITEVCMK